MNTHTINRVGFVYVIAEGLSLPVCKIGRTTQADAEIRCAQINSGFNRRLQMARQARYSS
jgi:hypothetical protein